MASLNDDTLLKMVAKSNDLVENKNICVYTLLSLIESHSMSLGILIDLSGSLVDHFSTIIS